jgi:hypothetical protein
MQLKKQGPGDSVLETNSAGNETVLRPMRGEKRGTAPSITNFDAGGLKGHGFTTTTLFPQCLTILIVGSTWFGSAWMDPASLSGASHSSLRAKNRVQNGCVPLCSSGCHCCQLPSVQYMAGPLFLFSSGRDLGSIVDSDLSLILLVA